MIWNIFSVLAMITRDVCISGRFQREINEIPVTEQTLNPKNMIWQLEQNTLANADLLTI
ncbi:hypothetical protein CA11_40650 [Gimesia maris]|nr:hypothetical protein CA11_40650 [Gimesia maris]